MEREQTLQKLRQISREAQETLVRASKRFDDLKQGVPSGAVFADEARISASKEYTQALQAHRTAAKRFSDFLFHGMLPSDGSPLD
jgi:hypothetical protein